MISPSKIYQDQARTRARKEQSTTRRVPNVPSLIFLFRLQQPRAMKELGRWPVARWPFPAWLWTIWDNEASFVIREPRNTSFKVSCQNWPDIIPTYVQLSIMHCHYHPIPANDAQWIHMPVQCLLIDVEVNVLRISCQLRASELWCQHELRKELQIEANITTHWELEFTNWEMIFMFRWFLARCFNKPDDEISL